MQTSNRIDWRMDKIRDFRAISREDKCTLKYAKIRGG
jgi:hypothetical protein